MATFHFVSLLRRSPWGGCEELWARTTQYLQQSGEHVTASVKWRPENNQHYKIRELSSLGIKLSYWAPRGEKLREWSIEPFNWIMQKLGIRRRWGGINYRILAADLVVFSSTGNEFPFEPIWLCQRKKQRYVLVIQSVSESTWPRDSAIADWRCIYNGCEAAYFVCHANKESTALQLGYDSDKFHVVSNPFNVDWNVPFTWPEQHVIQWAFVGRLEPGHKGVDLLLRAFAKDRWRNRKIRINLYGSGFSEESLKQTASMLGLDNRVKFCGHVDDIKKIWEANTLLILPSRHEGLPLAVIEAMLCGRPCLVTNVSGNIEHLDPGVTGFIAGGPTVGEVDAALEQAWESRDYLRSMGEAAYHSIRKKIPKDPAATFGQILQALTAKF